MKKLIEDLEAKGELAEAKKFKHVKVKDEASYNAAGDNVERGIYNVKRALDSASDELAKLETQARALKKYAEKDLGTSVVFMKYWDDLSNDFLNLHNKVYGVAEDLRRGRFNVSNALKTSR